MGLESATYINGLNASNPVTSDGVSAGDDHIRLLKSTIKATFPNVSGAVTPTHTELNYVDGVTSAIQTQLDAKVSAASPALTGIPTAPTAASSTNTTQLATCAFAYGEAGAALAAASSLINSHSAGASYTPTLSGVSGITGTGVSGFSYIKVANIVIVAGFLSGTISGAGSVGFTLTVPSVGTAAAGTGIGTSVGTNGTNTTASSGGLSGSPLKMVFVGVANGAVSGTMPVNFQYQVI